MSGGSERFVDQKIASRRILLWTKHRVPSCRNVTSILSEYALPSDEYEICEIDSRHDCPQIETYFLALCMASDREVPRLFVNQKYIGSERDIMRLHESGELAGILGHMRKH